VAFADRSVPGKAKAGGGFVRIEIHPEGTCYRWRVHYRGYGYTGLSNTLHGAFKSIYHRYPFLLEVTR
jgi:hypothetical protein